MFKSFPETFVELQSSNQVLPSREISSRVRRYCLIPLTEPYVRISYTAHLPIHTNLYLKSLLEYRIPVALETIPGFPSYCCGNLVMTPCWPSHPQTQCWSDWVSGIALFCTLTHRHCRNRFAFAVYCQLPMAYNTPPLISGALATLSLSQGGSTIFQVDGLASTIVDPDKLLINCARYWAAILASSYLVRCCTLLSSFCLA